jgi:hypothetical protein
MVFYIDRGGRPDSSDDAFITERLTQTLTRLAPVLAGMRYNFSSKLQIEGHLSNNHRAVFRCLVNLTPRRWNNKRYKWC